MIGKILLAGAGVLTGASLSEETKDKLRAAASGVRDDLRTATKDARERTATEWGRFTQFIREEILDKKPPRRPDPPAQA